MDPATLPNLPEITLADLVGLAVFVLLIAVAFAVCSDDDSGGGGGGGCLETHDFAI